MREVKPFATIALTQFPFRVKVSGKVVADFGDDWSSALDLTKHLTGSRADAERELKAEDPAKYWRMRYKRLEHQSRKREETLDAQVESMREPSNAWNLARHRNGLEALKSRKGDALKEEMQAIMKPEHLAGVDFKTFMQRWCKESIDGINCTNVGADRYEIEGEAGKKTFSWDTLRSYYSASGKAKLPRRVYILDSGVQYELREYLDRMRSAQPIDMPDVDLADLERQAPKIQR